MKYSYNGKLLTHNNRYADTGINSLTATPAFIEFNSTTVPAELCPGYETDAITVVCPVGTTWVASSSGVLRIDGGLGDLVGDGPGSFTLSYTVLNLEANDTVEITSIYPTVTINVSASVTCV